MDIGKRMLVSGLAILFLAAVFSQSAQADQTYTVTVGGEGKVTAVPDKAHIYCAVEAFSEKASEAVRLQAEKTEKFLNLLRDALKKRELDSKDVMTLGYAHQLVYKHTNNESVFTGYKVVQSFRVQTSVAQVGATLDKITEEALIQNVGFVVSDAATLEEQAVNLAIEDAKQKAERRAVKLGVKLGDILGYQESTEGTRPIRQRSYGMEMAVAAAPQLPPGEATITAQVLIVYELVRQ